MDQSILYIDVENLQDIAKQALISAINNWPIGFPKPGIIRLYVQADQTELWRIWASHQVGGVEVTVKGVQHYTSDGSKNSADIALALDVLTDMLKGKTRYVSILSDDSDFATLFSVLKQETALTDESKVPFMWFMTDRPNTRSSMLNDFFPSEYVHIVTCASRSANHDEKGHEIQTDGKPKDERDSIARFIIRNTTIGPFKSADCKKLIAKTFPKNPLAKLYTAH